MVVKGSAGHAAKMTDFLPNREPETAATPAGILALLKGKALETKAAGTPRVPAKRGVRNGVAQPRDLNA